MELNPHSPVAVGGLGGSGTRLVARFLDEAGFYTGSDRNVSLDNLWFTLLFKRPRRAAGGWAHELRIFRRAMTVGFDGRLDANDRVCLARALSEAARPGEVTEAQVRSIIESRRPEGSGRGWGWKEPNTHLFLPPLLEFFPGLKYVHVIRDGRDMALSSNRAQLENWGRRYGVGMPSAEERVPAAQLEFWIRANRAVLDFFRPRPADDFFCLDFDRLCRDPESVIRPLALFLGLTDESVTAAWRRLVVPPASAGRHRAHASHVFSAGQVREAEEIHRCVSLLS